MPAAVVLATSVVFVVCDDALAASETQLVPSRVASNAMVPEKLPEICREKYPDETNRRSCSTDAPLAAIVPVLTFLKFGISHIPKHGVIC